MHYFTVSWSAVGGFQRAEPTMSQLPSKFIDGAKKLKVNELTPYARKFASEELTTGKLSGRFNSWMYNYKTQYIDKGSPKPFFDVVAILFFGSYALAWPQELKHLRAEEAAKLEGKPAHH